MKRGSCPRLFEVEAMRDGRLAGAELATFERHMSTCAICSHEWRSLEALAQAVRAEPGGDLDELGVRRARTRLLAAFDGEQVAQEGRRWIRPSIAVSVLALAAAAGVFAWLRHPAAEPARAPLAPNVVIHADEMALYSRRVEGSRETIVLERGDLRIQAVHAAGSGSLLVELPDGELEDTGTIFTVTAADGQTTRVTVEEGSVVLRLRDQAPVPLRVGQTWAREGRGASAAPSGKPTFAPSSDPAPSSPPPTGSDSASAHRVTAASRAPSGPDAAEDFRAAMAAFEGGDNPGAAARFARFLADHPHDPRLEDAAYLRVLALQRAADANGRRAAALDYLRRHPTGFRRAEVEALAR